MEEDKLIEFLKRHLSKLLIGGACLLALALFWGRSLTHKGHSSARDYLLASQLFDSFISQNLPPQESFESMETILRHHPELRPSYDALLTHCLIFQEKESQALSYATSILTRVHEELPPLYNDFAKTSLLITERNYPQAFQNSLALEERLKEEHLPTLRAFNLLRLAFLAQDLKNSEIQMQAWQTLCSLPLYPTLDTLLQEGSFTLQDYFLHNPT